MVGDGELLRSYVENRDEPAFTELVRRYIGLVYSAALREAGGDASHAEDITQKVFTELAQKAAGLTRHPVLGGWLYTSVRHVAANERRAEMRRQRREYEAQTMNEMQAGEASETAWRQIQPALDDAMHELKESDRNAVILRYFEDRSYKEVGLALGLNENAARMRVERALEKLRSLLARRGVGSTAAGLSSALLSGAVLPAPPALAASVAFGAMAAGVTASSTTFTCLKLMSMTKLKTGILSAIIIAGVGAPLYFQYRTNARLLAENQTLRQQAEESSRLRAENERGVGIQRDPAELDRLQNDQGELLRLRGQVAVLRNATQQLAQAQAKIQELQTKTTNGNENGSTNGLLDGLKPVKEFVNGGIATPAATFETALWAKSNGDIKALAGTIAFDTEAKAKVETVFASLPVEVRARYSSVEEFFAALEAKTTPLAGMRVLDQTSTGTDEITLNTLWQYTDGRVRQNEWHFQRYNDGWRQMIPAGLVGKLSELATSPEFAK